MVKWKVLIGLSCLLSSYFYSFLALFGIHQSNSIETKFVKSFDHFFFVLFLIDMISKFITEFTIPGQQTTCRNLDKIAIRYLKGCFLIDLVALIPFHYFLNFDEDHKIKRLLLIKVIRFYHIQHLFDVTKMMNFVKRCLIKRSQKDSDDEGDDQIMDLLQ